MDPCCSGPPSVPAHAAFRWKCRFFVSNYAIPISKTKGDWWECSIVKIKGVVAALLTAQCVSCWGQCRARCQVANWPLQNNLQDNDLSHLHGVEAERKSWYLISYHTVLFSRSHRKERWQTLISSSLIGGSAVYSIDMLTHLILTVSLVSFTEQPRCRPLSSRPTGGAGGWQWRRLLRTCCVRPCCLAGAPCSSCWRGRASTPTCAQVQSASICCMWSRHKDQKSYSALLCLPGASSFCPVERTSEAWF